MKFLAFNGSPRGTNGNTDQILQPFLEGAREAGVETETVYLKDKQINYCVGCFTCWTKTPGVCIHKDDMPELLEKIRRADILIYASPLYIYTVTAQMKAFLDRHIPLADPHIVKRGDQFLHPRRYEDGSPKKTVLISNCGFPEPHHFSGMVETFRCLTSGPDTELAATILCAGGELLSQPALRDQVQWYIDAARRAGRETAEQGTITPETQTELDRPLSDPEIYSQMANAHWDSVIVPAARTEVEASDEEPGTPLPPPRSRDTLRDIISGMAMVFNPEEAVDTSVGAEHALRAIVQFQVTGEEPGEYYLRIAEKTCKAFEGVHSLPSLTIHTPSEVWMAISNGELDGAKGMMEGKYRVEGDLSLLMRFDKLFAEENKGIEERPPSGPSSGDGEPGTPLPPPRSLDTMRDTISGMAMIFNPEAATDPSAGPGQSLDAVIQFSVTGEDSGDYYLRIAEKRCRAFEGIHPEPTVTIHTPSDVWLAISRRELGGTEGFLTKKYRVEGDMGLLMRLEQLFPSGESPAPAKSLSPEETVQRGPLKLGMHWLMVAFVPWIVHWSTVNIPGLSPLVSIGVPLLLSILVLAYRQAFGRPTWMDTGTPIYFAIAGLVTLLGSDFVRVNGDVLGNMAMSGIWMGTLALATPLTANYSKWSYPPALWTDPVFLRTNAILTAFWGAMFLLMAAVALIGHYDSAHQGLWIVVRNVLLVPSFAFTIWFQKWYPIRVERKSMGR